MTIVVCIKQVPDTTEVRIDPVKGTLIRDGIPSIINPDDKNAIEEALKIKDKIEGTKVIALTMGPLQSESALREALAMGVDMGILLSDRKFAGSDTLATSYILSSAIRKIEDYDIIFCGRQAIDGDTAQVGPGIGEHLKIPQVTYVSSLDINGREVIVNRNIEDGSYVIKTKMPILLTAIKELNEPRYPSIDGIYKAYREKRIDIWTANDLDIDEEKIGLNGSPTKVKKSFTPSITFKGETIEGTAEEASYKLVSKLREKQII
ncbi:electron transfer flavoprotein subunit beta [Clostridium tetani]|uniref:Electron transfer flavoprotein small subunit n=1 Tax=Clostridium tetani TaxID=1513 RepID=A0A4Q0VGB2_CLOTA|nr:electron transfer flavoprotein subunit beta/FixA family protein [Clostridium tetani]RXI50137.1 electron transfer flavoprotein subunit beta [Clostridium tetani]BDR67865.1 electron transfer flavoprotein subunit beta [Clostridium tetani]BDR81800.1 electron transfer flavoprotein subunit beta [Clostridium tetani]BDR90182.1 electron transfer flavoprotein subunit beta [Clostridium tetani]